MRLFFTFVAVIACANSMSASANLAFDHSGNLFFEGRNTGTIVKYASRWNQNHIRHRRERHADQW